MGAAGIKLTIGANVRVGERTAQSGAAVRCHSCPPSLALALLATLGSATSMAAPLTCHGWLSANDPAVNNPYNATLIQLTPADMPMEQIITQLLPELVRECSEQAQLGFASTVKRALLALDAPTPQVQEVAPAPPASEIVAPKPPSPAPRTIRKPHQSNYKSRKPSQGHDHPHATGPGG